MQKLLNLCDKLYYGGGISPLCDEEYDVLRASNPRENLPKSSRMTVRHTTPMLSLHAFYEDDEEDFNSLLRKRSKFAALLMDDEVARFLIQPKYDGVALKAVYASGRLAMLMTRGDGYHGIDVTHLLPLIDGIPPEMRPPYDLMEDPSDLPHPVEVVGELCCSFSAFQEINALRAAEGLPLYKTPRHVASALINSKAPSFPGRNLNFIAFSVQNVSFQTELTALFWLDRNGFSTTTEHTLERYIKANTDNNLKYYLGLPSQKEYPTDGCVMKVNCRVLQRRLSTSKQYPNYAWAVKKKTLVRATQVTNIEYRRSKKGRITPVASITPVVLEGVTVSQVNLCSQKSIENKGIKVGSHLLITLKGGTIPVVQKVIDPNEQD